MLTIPHKLLTCLLLTLLVNACSSSGMFSNYNQQMYAVKSAQKQGQFTQAITALPERSPSDGSYNLTLLEKARLEYLANNPTQSQQAFEFVYQQVQQNEQAAKIQLSRGIEKLSAVVSNDNAIRYDIPYYEQSMINSYQALNYLNQNNLSGAMVEIRRANLVQNKALKANQKAINDSQQAMANKGVSTETLASRYPSQSNAIGKVKNGFQNAYTFYLSGVLYEAAGKANDAYIDYKKALEIYPYNVTLQKDVWRLAKTLGMTTDILVFKKRFSSHITEPVVADTIAKGQLVIILEQGIINNKQEVGFQLPIFTSHNDVRFYSVALPSYPNRLPNYLGVSLSYNGQQYQSEEIVRLQSLAAKQLQDDMPGIVTRQIVRLVAKEEVRQQMNRKGGDIGNIIATLYNMASEKADTRSWSTLPDSIHILRKEFTVGEHQLDLMVNGVKQTITININENRQTLVKLTSIDRYTDYNIINL